MKISRKNFKRPIVSNLEKLEKIKGKYKNTITRKKKIQPSIQMGGGTNSFDSVKKKIDAKLKKKYEIIYNGEKDINDIISFIELPSNPTNPLILKVRTQIISARGNTDNTKIKQMINDIVYSIRMLFYKLKNLLEYLKGLYNDEKNQLLKKVFSSFYQKTSNTYYKDYEELINKITEILDIISENDKKYNAGKITKLTDFTFLSNPVSDHYQSFNSFLDINPINPIKSVTPNHDGKTLFYNQLMLFLNNLKKLYKLFLLHNQIELYGKCDNLDDSEKNKDIRKLCFEEVKKLKIEIDELRRNNDELLKQLNQIKIKLREKISENETKLKTETNDTLLKGIINENTELNRQLDNNYAQIRQLLSKQSQGASVQTQNEQSKYPPDFEYVDKRKKEVELFFISSTNNGNKKSSVSPDDFVALLMRDYKPFNNRESIKKQLQDTSIISSDKIDTFAKLLLELGKDALSLLQLYKFCEVTSKLVPDMHKYPSIYKRIPKIVNSGDKQFIPPQVKMLHGPFIELQDLYSDMIKEKNKQQFGFATQFGRMQFLLNLILTDIEWNYRRLYDTVMTAALSILDNGQVEAIKNRTDFKELLGKLNLEKGFTNNNNRRRRDIRKSTGSIALNAKTSNVLYKGVNNRRNEPVVQL